MIALKQPVSPVDPIEVTAEIFTLEPSGTTCTIVTGLTGPPEVTVSYEGTAPPLTIFMHLDALGFAGLTPQPPPVEAIDWTTPDPARGTTHTVQSYQAVSVGRYDGPGADRDRAVDAARLIFERLTRSTLPPPPSSPATTPPATTPPAPTSANGNGNQNGRASRPSLPSAASPAAGNGSTSPAVPAADPVGVDPAGTGPTTVRALVIDADAAPSLRPVLLALGTVTEERPVTWTTEMRYRGNLTETHHRAVRFTVSVTAEHEPALLDALTGFRLRSAEVLDVEPARAAG